MKVELLLYIYLFVCVGMIVFNIVTAIVLRGKDRRTVRMSKNLYAGVSAQLENVRSGRGVDVKHKKYLYRKLKHIGNMVAFDEMLESAYVTDPENVREYLYELDSVFIGLSVDYSKKNSIETAYFPYIIKKYRMIANRPFPSIVGMLHGLLSETSIYCRENAMQALYTTGDVDSVIEAVRIIDSSELFFHGKLLSDGLLNFAGSRHSLNRRIEERFESFSDHMKVVLLNYFRFSTDECREFALDLLRDEKRDDEIRYAAIRYLGKYPLESARPLLLHLAGTADNVKWEYAAIASTALAAYPGADTAERLKNNLYSLNWYVRYNSASGLRRLGFTYMQLSDVIDGNDRYASEILRYCFERDGISSGEVPAVC